MKKTNTQGGPAVASATQKNQTNSKRAQKPIAEKKQASKSFEIPSKKVTSTKSSNPSKASEKVAKARAGGRKLVIVESPTKARTIRKFLGNDFMVESCMGHVRDLPASAKEIPEKFKKEEWAHLGVNVDKQFQPIYCVPSRKTKVVQDLKRKMSEASELYLATDEDREGESISWHLFELLKPQVPIHRMVFNEITKEAIQKALKDTRKIDIHLVKAQEARRILDRLVGYTISPLLWKKVAYGLSAGRVQSVAVCLISERELERFKFKRSVYWGVSARLSKNLQEFESKLHSVSGKKIALGKDFDSLTGNLQNQTVLLLDEKKSKELAVGLQKENWVVESIEEKPHSRKPSPPFITSTLQQEANRKLGWGARETMQVAQKLYEQGFITYMRTDSTFLSQEALQAARECILKKYGKEYLPQTARTYSEKKVKGAQEAHEAVRPAGQRFLDPDETGLDQQQLKLYEMIWKRTMASQMVNAEQKSVSVQIKAGLTQFSSHGLTIIFPGFLRAYVEGSDDPELELSEKEVQLPGLKKGDIVKCLATEATEHETKPPARFTEASLVQKMEKEGIGRPSTYSSIISTIIDRGYVKKTNNTLVPTFTALVVSQLLKKYLPKYVDLAFTSEMENSLDTIADGDLDSVAYLTKIYFGSDGLKSQVKIQEKKIDPATSRSFHLNGLKKYEFRVGKFGAYVCTEIDGKEVCASLPESEAPADVTAAKVDQWIEQKINGADALGKDPATGKSIYVLSGRYGPYVQLGESNGEKPKRVSIPAQIPVDQVQMKQALELLSLPKVLGLHPETKKEIKAGLGRFGPYIVCDGDFRSIPKGESVFETELVRALELLAMPKKGRGKKTPIKELGPHPKDKESLQIFVGPYGPYLKWGKKNFSVPKEIKPQEITFEQAIGLIGKGLENPVEELDKRLKKSKTKEKSAKKSLSAAKKKLAKIAKPVPRLKMAGKASLGLD